MIDLELNQGGLYFMKSVQLIKVFIASPGDVSAQRDEVERLIWNWNNEHTDVTNVVLMPIRWENNSIASYAIDQDGQAVINEQILKSSDILIAIFGNRIGTRTKNNKSGTVEEINVFYEHHSRGVGIFFVDAKTPDELLDERKMVLLYKKYLSKNERGLYQTYDERKIRHFISKQVHELMGSSVDNKGRESDDEKESSLQNIFDDLIFDYDEQLFFIFTVEKELRNFGARWMAKETLKDVEEWEQQHNLQNYLSTRYESVLIKLEQQKILSIAEYTEPGNPRLYTINNKNYLNLKKTIRNNPDSVQQLKSHFIIQSDPIVLDPDLPF